MWGQIAGMAGSLIGGMFNDKGIRKGRRAMEQGTQQGVNAITDYYNRSRDDLSPYMQAGTQGLSGLQRLMGGDYSGFQNSPDYQYARDQMVQGGDRSAASRGALFSGGHQVDMAKHLNGLASQHLGAYRNSLFDMAGMGQNSAHQLGQFGSQAGGQIGSMWDNLGRNRASSYGQQYGNYSDMTQGVFNGLSSIFGGMGGG